MIEPQRSQILVASEVTAAWFDLRGAQDRLAVAIRNADNQRNTLVLTQHRLAVRLGQLPGAVE